MARIVVTSLGSVIAAPPCTVLASALRARGHEVINDVIHRKIGSAPAEFARLAALCRSADLLISAAGPVSALVARHSRIAHVCLIVEPALLAHLDYQPIVSPPPRGHLRILASSAHFSVPDLTRYEDLRVSGFIFQSSPDPLSISERLDTWLRAGAVPIVLTLDSENASDAESLARTAVHAAAIAGCRIVVHLGTSPLNERALESSDVFVSVGESRDAIIARAAAVIHAGDIGTTAAALRCGVPMLFLPRHQTQFFNARAARRLGVAAAMRREGLEANALAAILMRKVLSDGARARARTLSQALAAEDGVAAVCTLSESIATAAHIPQRARPPDTHVPLR